MQTTRFYTIYRIVVLGLQNFIRNAWLSAAAIFVIIIATVFVFAGIILNVISQNIIDTLPDYFKTSIYLKESVSEADWSHLRHDLENHANVARVKYISTEAAQQRFVDDFGENQDIQTALLLLDDHPSIFPAALEVNVKDLNLIQAIADLAESERYQAVVASVSLGKVDAQTAIERATWMQNNVVKISLISACLFGLIAFLIIFNTIRITIFARREEIQIMHLIGAPQYFIRNPFLIEAGFFGVIAGSVATVIVYSGLIFVVNSSQTIPAFNQSYDYFMQPSIICLMLFGAILGSMTVSFFSCWVALRRYLKI